MRDVTRQWGQASYRATLQCLREASADQVIFVRNPLSLIRMLEPCLDTVSAADRVKILRISARNLRRFRTADGGYANLLSQNLGSTDALAQVLISRDAMRHLAGLPKTPLPGGEAFLNALLLGPPA